MEYQTIKFCILGDAAVGKTSFIKRFFDDKFSRQYISTIGAFPYVKSIQAGNQNYSLSFIDVSGNEKFLSTVMPKIQNCTTIIFMYDVTNKESFGLISKWIEAVKENNKIDGLQMYLIGSKIDLESERKIPTEAGKGVAEKIGMDFFEISSKSGENVKETMLYIIKKGFKLPNDFSGEIIMDQKDLNKKDSNQKKKK